MAESKNLASPNVPESADATPEPTSRAFCAPGDDWKSLDVPAEADVDGGRETARNSEALRQMLLSSLQMQHVVVLAGSGCSRCADGPSMQELWQLLVEDDDVAESATKAIEKAKHPKDLKNIEALLSRIEAYLQLQENTDLHGFLAASKGRILERCTRVTDGALDAHKLFLHRLSRRRARDTRLQLFTTNYDLCFERAAAALGCVALDGFSFTQPRRYDPRFFDYDIVRRGGPSETQYLEGVFLLYKLHGSINWAREVTWDGDGTGDVIEKQSPGAWEACLIYPAAGKYQQSYSQPYLESMARFLTAVRQPNTCVLVLGFGFNDDHLSQPLLSVAKSNPHLRVIVADPCAEQNATTGNAHWKELAAINKQGGDVWLVNADFPQFAELIPDLKALTPAQTLAKAVQGIVNQHD